MIATTILGAAAIALALLLATSWSPAVRRGVSVPVARSPRAPAPHQASLVDVAERTSRDVRSGMALRSALLDALAEHPGCLRPLHDRLVRGAPLAQALRTPAGGDSQTLSDDAAFVMHGLQLAADTGGAMADTLDRVVAVVRERRAWRAERHAQAAQARLSARMLTALPLAVAFWGLASGPRVRHAYVESPATGVLTAVGVVLNLTGWWWMHRLVRGPLPR